MAGAKKSLPAMERDALMKSLKIRFDENTSRHPELTWNEVVKRLEDKPDILWSLNEMEKTGGEPDVVDMDDASGAVTFMDCAAQSPSGRRSLCFDKAALNSRKSNKPEGSAQGLAEAMGIQLLTPQEYERLQTMGEFDTTTSSWLSTPPAMRKKGGALFGDRRYDRIFFYHNGVESYYAGRGFRGKLKV